MKRLFLAVIFMLIAASGAMAQTRTETPAPRTRLSAKPFATAAAAASTCAVNNAIIFTWTYVANLPVCASNGALEACYSGFTLTDTTTGAVLAAPATLGPTALTYTWTPSGGLFYGTQAFSLVANGFDSNSNPITSAPATTSATNAVNCLNAPTGLTATAQ